MVETQSRVHVIHVLQESEKILHLLKCDALHKMGKYKKKKKRVWVRKPVTNQERIIPAVLPEPLDHCSPVKNQPNIVMTRPVTTQ